MKIKTAEKKIKDKRNIFLFLFFGIFLSSCIKDNTIYHQYVNIDKNGWHQDSAAVFYVDVNDTISDYNVIIDIRNRNEYPNQNLYLFVSSFSPDSIAVTDTLNCILADNQGRWFGRGIGSTSNLPILYMPDINFPQSGIYRFEIKQGMRERTLKGISDIGLRVEKIEE